MRTLLTLLLTFLSAVEGSSINLGSEPGNSPYFPWPSGGTFRIEISRTDDLPQLLSLVARYENAISDPPSSDLDWNTNTWASTVDIWLNNDEVDISCETEDDMTNHVIPSTSGSEKTVVFIVQWTTEEIRVIHKGEVIGQRDRADGICSQQLLYWDIWMDDYGFVTATDAG